MKLFMNWYVLCSEPMPQRLKILQWRRQYDNTIFYVEKHKLYEWYLKLLVYIGVLDVCIWRVYDMC